MLLKRSFLIISLSLAGCKSVPEHPQVNDCSIHADINPPGFYCVDSKTKARSYLPFDHPSMKGGQALSAPDVKKHYSWIQALIEMIESAGE
jgi:hypothetical protein